MRSKRDSSRSACSLHRVGHAGLGDLLAVLLGDRAVVLAELLADRVHLLAQEVLALLLLRAGLDVVADALAHVQLGQPLLLELQRSVRRSTTSSVSSSSSFCANVQVGRVAGGVGQRAGIRDRADEGADAAVVAAQLEDLLDDGAVLALELARSGPAAASTSGRSSTSTRSTPSWSPWATPGTPRCSASSDTTPVPRMVWRLVTSATTPTLA